MTTRHLRAGRLGRLRAVVLRLVAGAAIGAVLGAAAQAAVPALAAGGASPSTGSAVTVSGRGEFAGMKFTVSQTKNLTNQAVQVTWTGGTPTTFAGSSFNTDFVQIMQCWGDDDGTVPGNPGPSRTQCQYGASPTTNRTAWPGNGRDDTRVVTYSPGPAHYGQDDTYGNGARGGQGEVPFKSVDGTLITSSTQNNPLFNYNTTNEIDFGRTSADGTGNEYFEVQTSNEAPHLGCGAPVTRNGVTTPRSCWLVIVPQGHLDLDGQPYADPTQVNAGSPVSSTNWKNRIAVKLGFNPIGINCALGSAERETIGSELVSDAMSSWQASLCSSGTVYGYTELGEPDARQRLISDGESGLTFTTRALGSDEGTFAPSDKTTYAPVAVSGVVIGFNIERNPKTTAPDSIKQLAGTKVQSINLTPRLVAKLLTESYRNSPWGAVVTKFTGGTGVLTAAKGYEWALRNPAGLITDPEFVKYNPEFADLTVTENPSTDTDLITALGHSDSAHQLWTWIESDKDARKFLAGSPDEWGMQVNPYYSTNADINPLGLSFDPLRDDYPKSDPWCTVPSGSGATEKQCMTDFHPYVDDMHAGALSSRRGDTLWKASWDPLGNPPGWKSTGPQLVGQRFMLTVTDAASASRFGLQTAKLRNASGTFAAPTAAALTAAAATASGTGGVRTVSPDTKKAKSAYPLTEVVYAAARPAKLPAAARNDYAKLLRYAANTGQISGSNPGQLPIGYAPLSETLRAQARDAATTLVDWKTAPPSSSGGGSDEGSGSTPSQTPDAAALPSISPSSTPSPSASVTFGGGTAVALTLTGTTPADPSTDLRYAVPVGAALGLLAALGAPFTGGLRRLPIRLPLNLPGGRSVTALPRFTLPAGLRRPRLPRRGKADRTPPG
ncbi:hypothetical protein Pth03_50860 [Planotetraspora thailandica]|uniref:PBP domain-containing protein n=1 Tax=Planotetraspora thailandica TaxID=487172 RepID=A0A8J3V743_9ACTN|nr:hypothetical protein [Planotetraspora thailandica]GII56697.1 hypothetical protein Pth03_50860 [Planotetraspora thailandica]